MQTAAVPIEVAPQAETLRVAEFRDGYAPSVNPRVLSASQKIYRAVHAREYNSNAPNGIDVWKYGYPMPSNHVLQDVLVRLISPPDLPAGVAPWIGVFECARGRHVDVVPWPEAEAVVVSAANAAYIVNPRSPEQFTGFSAQVEINGIAFDEGNEHLYIAESLRVHAFSKDRRLRWISEPLDGYDARLCGCSGRIVAVEVKHDGVSEDDPQTSVIRLRAEDGTILRSRFRLARHHWLHRAAA